MYENIPPSKIRKITKSIFQNLLSPVDSNELQLPSASTASCDSFLAQLCFAVWAAICWSDDASKIKRAWQVSANMNMHYLDIKKFLEHLESDQEMLLNPNTWVFPRKITDWRSIIQSEHGYIMRKHLTKEISFHMWKQQPVSCSRNTRGQVGNAEVRKPRLTLRISIPRMSIPKISTPKCQLPKMSTPKMSTFYCIYWY